jgi:electron transfer flavoprotein alpha subunit
MPGILVYSEKEEIAWELLEKASVLVPALGGEVSAALLGPGATAEAPAAFTHGAQTAYVTEAAALADLPSDLTAEALFEIVRQAGAQTVLIGSTLRGKALAPRLAQKLGAGCVSDAIGLDVEGGKLVARRYAFGGKTVATEVFKTDVQVVALAPKNSRSQGHAGGAGRVVPVALSPALSRLRVIARQPRDEGAVDIAGAERLVGAGRGLKKREDLAVVEELAGVLGAAVGCTRTLAYDLRWLPDAQLIGLSGKKCSPRVYVAVGVSGQVQHMMGVNGSRLIVAINSDKDAPIFQAADYGVVGDLYQVVPRLIAYL